MVQGEHFPNAEVVFSITYSETLGWVKVLGGFGKVAEDQGLFFFFQLPQGKGETAREQGVENCVLMKI